MKKLFFALAMLLASPAAAQWQTPAYSVPVGRGGGNTGFDNAAPGAAGIPLTSAGVTAKPRFAPAQNNGIAPGAANTMKGTTDGVATSDIVLTACTLTYQITKWVAGTGWQCGLNPVLPSRAVALTLDLSAFSAVTTQGHATPGDGGGATLVKTTSSIIDTNIATGTISANGTSTCTNGTYFGVQFSGGTGALFEATVIVAGNVVTSITQTGISPGYTIADVLTAAVGSSPGGVAGCSGAVRFTVSTLTTPTCSFTDIAANKWQLVMPGDGVDARQCGVKMDYVNSDATATDNYTTLTNALTFAGYRIGSGPDTGGRLGGRVLLPAGGAMICGAAGSKALQIPYGVWLHGQGSNSSIIKICNTWGTSTNYIELCNTQSHLACFSTQMRGMQVFSAALHDTGAAVNTLAAVYSNNIQQQGAGLYDVLVYPGSCRIGLKLETGFGGASTVEVSGFETRGGQDAAHCSGNSAPAIFVNYGTTQVILNHINISGFSPSFNGPRDNGLVLNGGVISINNLYVENVVAPVLINMTGALANSNVTLHGFHAGTACVWGITLAGTNTLANFLFGGPMAINSCSSGMVLDGQPAGVNMVNPQVSDRIFNP